MTVLFETTGGFAEFVVTIAGVVGITVVLEARGTLLDVVVIGTAFTIVGVSVVAIVLVVRGKVVEVVVMVGDVNIFALA